MDAQANHGGRRRRRRKKKSEKKASPVEPVVVAARRPDSPRLEKPTRRMKAASAKPRTLGEASDLSAPREEKSEPRRRRAVRIIQRKEDEIDAREQMRRRLLSRFMAAEGRAAITRAADTYLSETFEVPCEQEAQLKMLEHFDEDRARAAIAQLTALIDEEEPRQLPVLRQRLRRLEDYADDTATRDAAAELRRTLPA